MPTVKADVAELKKKSQVQSQQSTPTCAKRTDGGPKLPNIEKALSDTENKLADQIRDTQSTILQLVEEEKVLIHAEVVQLSRAVGEALENAKGKMAAKVAEFTGGNEHGRKRSRSTAGLDESDDDDAGEKRVKEDEESEVDEDGTDDDDTDDDDCIAQRRQNSTAIDEAVLDIMSRAYKALDCERVGREWVLMVLFKFHSSADDETLDLWEAFQSMKGLLRGSVLVGNVIHLG
ncbi:hypothetical protein B0T13DRAFT_514699 [Neurospora crassa]|nr:hypothetical protein B0T13DRAFT_515826 [Neurospora crassa]KAK3489725.1 hypothetical protein B0T13DRAFT_514699 [Neurospora crassa]